VDFVELSEDEFARFQEFIYRTCGIRVPETKRSLLSSRIRRRLSAEGFEDFSTYFQHLTSHPMSREIERFLDVVTTNETFFYRTEKHFDWFQSEFIPQMVSKASRGIHPRSLRVWSAACSTGEEAYTLALCLVENKLRLRDWELQILGTDISAEAIERARQGEYKARSIAGLTEKRRKRYFTQSEDERWQVRPVLRDLVEFQRHNLIQPLNAPLFDCIFLRNVLIYFDKQSKQKVVDNLTRQLADQAWLVVGPSEGVYDMLGDLKKHSTFLYQKVS
jgi:chemotaxis protein methyltransferase CheR